MIENESSLKQQIVSDPNEVPLILHSRINQPISDLSLFQKSLLFAELSMIAMDISLRAIWLPTIS